ncbi:tumor necrosis factor receptor superfamily member 25 [Leptodactylus fuscus]|uniref:tumor necrosis factor receptor superfamily member 25 n=1 Tax=Leptodactylus fuscus TaxID=238119 RepID=UPI003F4EA31C
MIYQVCFTESVFHKNIRQKSNKRFNSSNDEANQLFHSLQRYKRSDCEDGTIKDEDAGRCCRLCPKGEYVQTPCSASGQDTVCKPCEEGTFLRHSNYKTKCQLCRRCQLDTEVEVGQCSAAMEAVCECKEGYYRLDEYSPCQACIKCHNQRILTNCSTNSNTECGDCLPGFYKENDVCQPCPKSDKQCENTNYTNSGCPLVCKPVASAMPVSYILTGVFLLLLLPFGGLLIYKHKRKKKNSKGELIFTVHGGGDVPGLSDINQETRILTPVTPGHVPSVLQKSSTLYDIIDCVPVRRWKEFMRTLELPDKVIEIVEVETTNFRDQQYEMLRRWCQLKMANVDAVYQTLDRMNLSGCAEELKAKLEHYS